MRSSELKTAEQWYGEQLRKIRHQTAASLSAPETEAEQQRRIDFLLRPVHYDTFWNYYLGASAGGNLGEKACAGFHTAAYRQLQSKPIITQFRIWFRGSGKSLQTNVGNALALKQRGELRFMLLVGINELRARLLLADLQAQLEANERLLRDFGKQVAYGHWKDGAFETTDGCYFMALGIDQPFRGLRRYANRIDLAVVDDCEDRKTALNPRLVEERCDKVTRDLIGAFSKERQRLVICNNFIVRHGLVEILQERLKNASTTHISKQNIATPSGKPTWSEAWSHKDIKELQARTDPFTWASEYMNQPIERGKVFKPEWIRWAPFSGTAKPSGAVIFWDLSYKAAGDYKACAVVGSHDGCLLLLEVFCRRCELAEAMDWHYERITQWRAAGWPLLAYYDATAAQEVVFSPIWQEAMQRNEAAELPQADHSAQTDKHLRIQATLTSYLHNGQLRFAKALKDTPDMEAGLAQLLAFEKGSTAPDDFPDALEAAVRKCAHFFGLRPEAQRLTPVLGKRTTRTF